VPDLDYLIAKGIDLKDPRVLFDKLTLQMNKVSDTNLKQDLLPLFTDRAYIENWLKNWRDSYLRLFDDYKIHTVTALREINVKEDFSTDNFSFIYTYDTLEKDIVKIVYAVTYEWIKFQKPLGVDTRDDLMGLVRVESRTELNDQIKQFIALFFRKNASYFGKVNNIMIGDTIITKVIRMTADSLNQKEQILLNKSALLSCELDDLLK
jgi:DNA-binding Lrp family transcriptional regulator